jgi:hypothetical protein
MTKFFVLGNTKKIEGILLMASRFCFAVLLVALFVGTLTMINATDTKITHKDGTTIVDIKTVKSVFYLFFCLLNSKTCTKWELWKEGGGGTVISSILSSSGR